MTIVPPVARPRITLLTTNIIVVPELTAAILYVSQHWPINIRSIAEYSEFKRLLIKKGNEKKIKFLMIEPCVKSI